MITKSLTRTYSFSEETLLIVAVSGGVDSMVLLHSLEQQHPKNQIIVAHFDHSLRGDESDGDRQFVEAYALSHGLRYKEMKLDIGSLSRETKMSIEATARKYRYEFLIGVARECGAGVILTAHHLDDRIETAMFNLIRGSKLSGIHALSHHEWLTEDIALIRPLLSVTKSEIRTYAREHALLYREDTSNLDTQYLRNKLRLDILPQFESINPEYRAALSNFIEYSEGLKSWIDEEVEKFLDSNSSFLVGDFEEQSSFFQKEIIRYLYEQAHHGTIGLSEGNIDEIQRYILTAHGGTEKKIGNLMLNKRQGRVAIVS